MAGVKKRWNVSLKLGIVVALRKMISRLRFDGDILIERV
jgi:hypothetical protein